MSESYAILSRPFYLSTQQCYINVLTIDRPPIPKSKLYKIMKKTNFHKLSPFQEYDNCYKSDACGFVFINPAQPSNFATNQDIPILFSWLMRNNYKIDSSITQMVNMGAVKMDFPILAFISK